MVQSLGAIKFETLGFKKEHRGTFTLSKVWGWVEGGRDEAEDMLLRKKGEGLLSTHGVPHHLYNLQHFDKGIFKFIFHSSIIYPFDESKDK